MSSVPPFWHLWFDLFTANLKKTLEAIVKIPSLGLYNSRSCWWGLVHVSNPFSHKFDDSVKLNGKKCFVRLFCLLFFSPSWLCEKGCVDSEIKMIDQSTQDFSLCTTPLSPCSDNFNCLRQHSQRYGLSHNAQYSHPCPFSELCPKTEPHFTHEPHRVSLCRNDKRCNQLVNPFHRAEYRHTDLPDYLLPCRYQAAYHETSPEHRMTYSHGEQVYKIKESSGTGRT